MNAERSSWWPPEGELRDKRIVRYEIAIQRCAYIGAGYGGVFLLAGLGGDQVFGNAPWWLEPTLASVITLGIVMLAWAYLRFTWCLRDVRLQEADSAAGRYPRLAHWMYVLSIVPLVAAAAIVLVATWIIASSQMPNPTQSKLPMPSPTP